MLETAGFDTGTAIGGLTAFSLLGVGGLLALPVLALPAMLIGALVSPGLVHTAILGIAGFVLLAVLGSVLLFTNRPLALAGRAAQWLINRVTRRRPPMTGLDTRLLAERDTIRIDATGGGGPSEYGADRTVTHTSFRRRPPDPWSCQT